VRCVKGRDSAKRRNGEIERSSRRCDEDREALFTRLTRLIDD
jgi:hypothetical protein